VPRSTAERIPFRHLGLYRKSWPLAANDTAQRNLGGRPRSFSDEEVYRAVIRVLARDGYRGISLAAVARELGVTGPALNRRFGNLPALLRGFLRWTTASIDRNFAFLRQYHASPLDIVRARSFIPVGGPSVHPEVDRQDPTNFLLFFTSALVHGEYREELAELNVTYEAAVIGLLDEAVAAGELLPCDTRALAHLLSMAMTGAMVRRLSEGGDATIQELSRAFDMVIEPHLPRGTSR
jgi:AcrR family transcriptional regulator